MSGRMPAAAAIAAVIGAMLAVAGCSSSGSSSSRGKLSSAASLALSSDVPSSSVESGTGSDSVVTPSDEPSNSSSQVAGLTISGTFTDSQGWTYAVSFDVPSIPLELSKDVSTSPPGQAKFSVTAAPWQGFQYFWKTFDDDNPGRTGGPEVTLDIAEIYDVPAKVADINGPCSKYSDTAIVCLGSQADIGGTGAYSQPESEVDALISALNGKLPVAYLISDDSMNESGYTACGIEVTAGGKTKPDSDSDCSGKWSGVTVVED